MRNPNTPARRSLAQCVASPDPLADDACDALLRDRIEDDFVDYKEDFNPELGKAWIDVTVDATAFANADGGYLVFGVKDGTGACVGIPDMAVAALTDTKKVLEKLNRFVMPQITRVGVRSISYEGKRLVALHVPPSLDSTHIFELDAEWTPPGTSKSLLAVRKGSVFVRRTGTNAILTSSDFEKLVQRRLERFRARLLDGVLRIASADPTDEIVTVRRSYAPDGSASKAVVIDAPEGSQLAGKEVELAVGNVAARARTMAAYCAAVPGFSFDLRALFELYVERHSVVLTDSELVWAAEYSLRNGAPAFQWLGRLEKDTRLEVLSRAFGAATYPNKLYTLRCAGFFSKSLFEKLRGTLSQQGSSYALPRFDKKQELFNVPESATRQADEGRATELAAALAKEHDQMKRGELERLDCALYAPF